MRRRGVSLVDTILALILVTVVVLVAVNMFPQALWSTRMQEHRLVAGGLASSTLREVASRPDWLVPGPRPFPPVEVDHVTFERQVKVIALPGVDPNLYLSLWVEITWKSLTRQEQSLVRELGVCRLSAP